MSRPHDCISFRRLALALLLDASVPISTTSSQSTFGRDPRGVVDAFLFVNSSRRYRHCQFHTGHKRSV